jgi:hypothetical protein
MQASIEYPKIQSVFLRDPETNHKTFLMRQWTLPEFEYLCDLDWLWTEKIDGTNIRVEWDGVDLFFKGRTDKAKMQPNLNAKLSAIFDHARFHKAFPEVPDEPITLYGEGYGVGVQKGGGGYIPDDTGFILFDVRVGSRWLKFDDVEDIALKMDIPVVPVIGKGPLSTAINMTQYGIASYLPGASCQAEGLVMRPAVDLFSRNGHRVITKVKTRDFAK